MPQTLGKDEGNPISIPENSELSGIDKPILCVQVLQEHRRGWTRGFLKGGTVESFQRTVGVIWIRVQLEGAA